MGLYLLVLIAQYAIAAYEFVLVAYVLSTMFPNASKNKLVQIMAMMVEPFLAFFKRFVPMIGIIDITPIVALLVLQYAAQGIIALLQMFVR